MRDTRTGGICLGMALIIASAGACQYNVRDLGFMDIGDRAYVLSVYVQDAPADQALAIKEISESVFNETNVRVQVISVGEEAGTDRAGALKAHPGLSLPAAIFESPDGQTWPMPMEVTHPGWQETLRSQWEALVVSGRRDAMLRAASQAFAVILFLEGTDPEATGRARAEVVGAIEEIRAQMAWMPKAVARPPEMVALDAAAQAGEAILLWSLGLSSQPVAEPRAAVIYGRARWIGPIASGLEITEGNMARLLSIIGADCECGLDISWTRGTPLPVRWSRAMHEQVVKSLGFDPDNPMVQIEASRILSRYGGSQTPGFGYQEIELAGAGASRATLAQPRTDSPALLHEAPSAATAGAASRTDPISASTGGGEPIVRQMLVVVGGLGAGMICLCLVILWRAFKRNQSL